MREIDNDLVILCGSKQIASHCDIVRTQTETLEQVFVPERWKVVTESPFLQLNADTDKNLERNGVYVDYVLDLRHENPHAVEVLIWFLYFGNYPPFEDDPSNTGNLIFGDSRFSFHVDVYTLALKHGVPTLASLAKKLLHNTIDTHFNDDLFVKFVRMVYQKFGNDKGLRDLAVSTTKPWLKEIMGNKRDRSIYEVLFRDFPTLMVDLIPEIYSCISTIDSSDQDPAPLVEANGAEIHSCINTVNSPNQERPLLINTHTPEIYSGISTLNSPDQEPPLLVETKDEDNRGMTC